MILIPGKWYVIDRFGDADNAIVAGPFDTESESETERVQLNIADDCYSAQRK